MCLKVLTSFLASRRRMFFLRELGMTRALYRERAAAGAGEGYASHALQKTLTQALEFSERDPDTLGHRAGSGRADKAVALL